MQILFRMKGRIILKFWEARNNSDKRCVLLKEIMENCFRNSPLSFKKIIDYFACPILASMLKVACGTALNLALSISLLVTLQMP